MFATDEDAFVEQYYYRDHKRHVDLPVLHYAQSEQVKEFISSFETMWTAAKPGIWDDAIVGTDGAVEDAGIVNIYRREQRSLLGRRQGNVLKDIKGGECVRILSISGKFYVSYPIFESLREAAKGADGQEGPVIRFALLNPVCSQAIYRAVADMSAPADILKRLATWDWAKHSSSDLYLDVHRTVRELLQWRNTGCRFEVRLFSCSVACSLFLAPRNYFVEQYLFGRSQVFEKGRVLGGEYPVFEYENVGERGTREREILSSSFDVLWNYFTIDAAEYQQTLLAADKEREAFQRSLEDVQRWLPAARSAEDTTTTERERDQAAPA
jgi:hypothetical protein